MDQLRLQFRRQNATDAKALQEGSRIWLTAYPIRKTQKVDVGGFVFHMIAAADDPVASGSESEEEALPANPAEWLASLGAERSDGDQAVDED